MLGMRLAVWIRGAAQTHPGLMVFGLAFLAFSISAAWMGPLYWDAEAAALPAYQLAATGSPWLEDLHWNPTNPWFVAVDGHVVSNRQIGVILLAVPFYFVFGPEHFVAWPSALAAVTATAAAVALMHLAVRAIAPPAVAWGASLVIALGSPTWTVSGNALWGHTATQLSIAAAAYFASRNRWWMAGWALAFGIMARPHIVAVALALALVVGISRRSTLVPVAIGIPSILGTALLLMLNHAVFGRWSVTGYSDYVTRNLAGSGSGGTSAVLDYMANWAGFLISPSRGLFFWTPVAIVLLPAALRSVPSAPDWVPGLLLGGLGYTAIQLRINDFDGGSGFIGYRHPLELVTTAIPLYALAWQATRGWVRGVVKALILAQVLVMYAGAMTDSSYTDLVIRAPALLLPLTVLVLVIVIRVALLLGRSARLDGVPHFGKPDPPVSGSDRPRPSQAT